jgi:DNA-binding NarL/FixJ family response regulator
MTNTVNFLLADNQDITRAGIQYYLTPLAVNSVEEVADKATLLARLAAEPTSAVVLDYTLFDIQGIDDLLVMVTRFPQAHWLLFSDELSEDFIRRVSLEPQVSMMLKNNSGDEIRTALQCVARGERFLCHQVTNLLLTAAKSVDVHSVLTPTELDILRMIARGLSVKEIAQERVSSIHTIVTHKKNIFRKLEVNNVYEATKYALRAGLVEMVEYYL